MQYTEQCNIQNIITFHVGSHSFTVGLFDYKILKIYIVDGSWRVIVGI